MKVHQVIENFTFGGFVVLELAAEFVLELSLYESFATNNETYILKI